MFKNRIKKFIIVLLSAILIIPAFTVNKVSAASNDVTTVFVGVDYEYFVQANDSNNFKDEDVEYYVNLGAKDAIISFCEGHVESSAKTDAFVDGEYKGEQKLTGSSDNKVVKNYLYVDYLVSGKSTITVNFHKTGEYLVVLSPKNVTEKSAYFKKFRVVDNPNDAELKLEYKTGANLTTAIADYSDEVKNAIKDSENNQLVVVGKDSFKVPKVNSLINSSFAYSIVKKSVYYCIPGELSYKNTTATSGTPSFSLSKFGTYRFYVLLETDNLVDNVSGKIQVSIDGLKEFENGFYQMYNGTDAVYYNAQTNLYYKEKTFETLINTDGNNDDKTDDGILANNANKTLIVPIFTFDIEKVAPQIEVASKVLEDGYKGAKYSSVGKINVYGNPEEVTYTLQYRESKFAVDWTDLDGEEESFNSSELTFIPTKLGEYRIKVVARTSGFDEVELATPVISVSQEYIEYQYKVSFSDWLSVNVLPFVLLCISALCLIGIILLLVIKPKNKTNKIQIKEEDR